MGTSVDQNVKWRSAENTAFKSQNEYIKYVGDTRGTQVLKYQHDMLAIIKRYRTVPKCQVLTDGPVMLYLAHGNNHIHDIYVTKS